MTKFTIEYRRTVRTGPYESLTIGLTEEFDRDTMVPQTAYEITRQWVNQWLWSEQQFLERQHPPKPRK